VLSCTAEGRWRCKRPIRKPHGEDGGGFSGLAERVTTGQKICHLTKERTDDCIFTVYIVLDPYDFGHASTKNVHVPLLTLYLLRSGV